jgi:hypothetical protein
MKNKKIILDTNLWISFLITKNFNQIEKMIESGKITLVFSDELIEEFIEVVGRPKFKKYFSKKDVEKVFAYFDQFGELFSVKSNIKICRDKKDNFLLNLSADSNADYLLTGDKDLLVLEKIEKTKIITFTDFIKDMG